MGNLIITVIVVVSVLYIYFIGIVILWIGPDHSCMT